MRPPRPRRWLLLLAMAAAASAQAPAWLQVAGPHFAVVSDGAASPTERVVEQMESMRAVFHALFPDLPLDTAAPMDILALRNRREFDALLPAAYQGRNRVALAGYFMPASAPGETDETLIRLDAGLDPQGDRLHPYAILYHEYTHRLLRGAPSVPLWLDEGLAQFYENTDINGRDAVVGQANLGALAVLRDAGQLLPLRLLLTIKTGSAYYHENDRANLFYAESWALTHYLIVEDRRLGLHRVADYLAACRQGADSWTAANQAWGDLAALEAGFDAYRQRRQFTAFAVHLPAGVSAGAFTTTPVPAARALALEAEARARNAGQPPAARAAAPAGTPAGLDAAATLADLARATVVGVNEDVAAVARTAVEQSAPAARRQVLQAAAAAEAAPPPPLLAATPPADETQTAEGTITAVTCTPPNALRLTLQVGNFNLVLATADYRQVPFRPLNFSPGVPLDPCTAAQGLSARIEYRSPTTAGDPPRLLSVSLIQ